MNPHPRLRTTVKWGGLALCLIFLAAWGVFPDRTVVWGLPGTGWCGRVEGCLGIVWNPALEPRYRGLYSEPGGRTQWWPVCAISSDRCILAVPCWLGASVSLLACLTARHLDTRARRRVRLGLCPTCNYDRTGLPADAICPECGLSPSPTPPSSVSSVALGVSNSGMETPRATETAE